MKRPGPHEHYCTEHGSSGHRWRCTVDPCVVHDTAPCGALRCRLCATELVPTDHQGAATVWECPFRWKEPGHEAGAVA